MAPNIEAGPVIVNVKTSADTAFLIGQVVFTVTDSAVADLVVAPSTNAVGFPPERLLITFVTSHRNSTNHGGGMMGNGSTISVAASTPIYAAAHPTYVRHIQGSSGCELQGAVQRGRNTLIVALAGVACVVQR